MIGTARNAALSDTQAYTRLRNVEICLDEFRVGRTPSILTALWNMRVMHDEYQHFAGVPELCCQVETQLIRLENGCGDTREEVVRDTREIVSRIRHRITGGLPVIMTPLRENATCAYAAAPVA